MAKNSILEKLKKTVGNVDGFLLSDETNPYKIDEYFDTGCFILNAALSDGDIFKGLPLGKRVGVSGPSGVAKSYFMMSIIKSFLERKDNSYAVVFETEGSSINEMCESLNVDVSRVLVLPVYTVEEFRTQCIRLLDDIKEQQASSKKNKEEFPSYIIGVDSLGMLATHKESEDARSGNEKQDMTRAKIIKSIFRLITLPLAMTKTPMLIANHTYGTQELYSRQVTSGGEGFKYATDISMILSKAQDKVGTERTGSVITLTMDKSRFIPEGQKFKINLSFSKGIHPYSSMITMAEDLGVIKKEGHGFILPNGDKVKSTDLKKNIQDYFNEEFMTVLRDKIKSKVGFGCQEQTDEFEEDEEE